MYDGREKVSFLYIKIQEQMRIKEEGSFKIKVSLYYEDAGRSYAKSLYYEDAGRSYA